MKGDRTRHSDDDDDDGGSTTRTLSACARGGKLAVRGEWSVRWVAR